MKNRKSTRGTAPKGVRTQTQCSGHEACNLGQCKHPLPLVALELLRHLKERKRLGAEVAAFLLDAEASRARVQAEVATAEARAREALRGVEDSRSRAGEAWRELREILGLAEDAPSWRVRAAIQDLRTLAREAPGAGRHRRLTETVRRALESYGFEEPTAPSGPPDSDPLDLVIANKEEPE